MSCFSFQVLLLKVYADSKFCLLLKVYFYVSRNFLDSWLPGLWFLTARSGLTSDLQLMSFKPVLRVGCRGQNLGILSVSFPSWIPLSPTTGISPRLELVPLTVLDPRLKARQTNTHCINFPPPRANSVPALPVFIPQCCAPCSSLELYTHFRAVFCRSDRNLFSRYWK